MTRTLSVLHSHNRLQTFALTSAIATSLLFLLVAAPKLQAQATTYTSAPPQIVVSANGEIAITPDRANIQLGVETQSKTASAASAENNKKQNNVLAAIKALGIPASAITTSSYSVTPIQNYDGATRKTTIDGYRVSDIVVVNVAKIEQTGSVIDAALAAGANRVASLNFELADPSKAREEALSKAVAQARERRRWQRRLRVGVSRVCLRSWSTPSSSRVQCRCLQWPRCPARLTCPRLLVKVR